MENTYNNCKEKRETQEYIDKLCSEYIEKHLLEQERDELITENNIEKRDVKGYHGREILELLQNADDAYQKSIDNGERPACDLEVLIEYKDDILTISNTGTSFDKDGIKAIVQGNNSPKSGKYIGNKGTGFRSILNWSDKVKIYSGCFNIEFSKENAESKLQEIKNEKQIQKQILKKHDLYIPMLAVPVNIEGVEQANKTVIEITINPNKSNDDYGVTKQLENIDLRILMFLPNISKIEILMADTHIVYKRKNYESIFACVDLQKYIDGEIDKQEEFYLFKKVIEKAVKEDDTYKDIRLAIAVPRDYDLFKSRHLYSFFPLLEARSPFNCVMHASYALGDHRDTINRDPMNKKIVEEQLKFLVEIAEKFIACKKDKIALKLLLPINFENNDWKFNSSFSKFELEDYYLDLLEQVKMLITVNDDYISVRDNPKIFNCDFPSFFLGHEFDLLLKPLDTRVLLLVEMLSHRLSYSLSIEELELKSIINSINDNWTASQQVEVFDWWNRNYEDSLPNLLKTQSGQWLKYNDECYLLVGDFENKGLPTWVKFPVLDAKYQKMLFEKSDNLKEIQDIRENDKDTHISRLICQNNIYPSVKFAYRDRSNIVSTVNSSVDTYNKSIDFVKWLWANYGAEVNWNPPQGSDKSPIKYKFPNKKEKAVHHADKMYFASDYGNNLAEKLFDESYAPFINPDLLSISKEDSPIFQEFIAKFGVKSFPLIEQMSVSPLDAYDTHYENIIKKHGELGASSSFHIKYNLPFIKHLEDKLRDLSCEDIIRWIYEDSSLYSYLSNQFYSDNAQIEYCGNRQQYFRRYNGTVENYILFIFNEVKWLDIEGEKYSPTQVLKHTGSRHNGKFARLVPVMTSQFLQDIAGKLKIDYDEVLNIIGLFDFCEKVTDLSSDDFYGLMIKLATYEFQESLELSKIIYRIVEQANFTKTYHESDNKDLFFEEGMVLVQYQGNLQYMKASESYLPSSKIINKKVVPIVEKGQRTNNENFSRIFACKQYNKEYSVLKQSISQSKCNLEFQKYFTEFIKYACAYGERNENFERDIKNLSVVLVDKIDIIENEQIVAITEEYICVRESATKWYITVFSDDYDINEISESIENICINIANTPGFESSKIGEIFRTKDQSDREFLIKKEFGSLDVVMDKSYDNELKNNFIMTLKKISEDYSIESIDIDFRDFSNHTNSPKIIRLLSSIKTDVDQFKDMGFVYPIDLVKFYKTELTNLIYMEKQNFKNYLFNQAMEDEVLQVTFLKNVRRFENFEIDNYDNSIYFDIDSKVTNKFGEWRKDEEKDTFLDADREYSRNYESINPDKLFEDEISNNLNVQQMIYFNKSKEFEAWLEEKNLAGQSNTSKQPDIYSKYRDVIPKQEPPVFRDLGENKRPRKTRGGGVYTPTSAESKNRKQKVYGNKGELLIYNLLCEQFGGENVFPNSEAFIEIGLLKPGQASSGQYDISYKDESGNRYFVEVKTGDGKSFLITPGELEFAEQNPDRFKLILVHDLDEDVPRFTELPTEFWKDKKFRKTEIIERIQFEF